MSEERRINNEFDFAEILLHTNGDPDLQQNLAQLEQNRQEALGKQRQRTGRFTIQRIEREFKRRHARVPYPKKRIEAYMREEAARIIGECIDDNREYSIKQHFEIQAMLPEPLVTFGPLHYGDDVKFTLVTDITLIDCHDAEIGEFVSLHALGKLPPMQYYHHDSGSVWLCHPWGWERVE